MYEGGELPAVGGGFDPDRFGYFDLVEELNKLGIERWKRLSFKKPWSVLQVDIKSDVEVMEMIKLLREVRTQMCYVYVVDGKNDEQEQLVQDKSVGVGSSVLDSMGGEGMKQSVIESIRQSKVESVVKRNYQSTTRKKETAMNGGKMKDVEKFVEKSVDKRVQKSVCQYVKKSFVEHVSNYLASSVNASFTESVGEGAGEGMGEGACEDMGAGAGEDVGDGADAAMGEGVG